MLPHARTLPIGLLTAMLSGGLGATDAKAQTVFVASKVQITSTSGTVAATTPEGSKVIVPQTPSASGEASVGTTQRAGSVVETGPDSQATLAIPGAGTLLMGADTQVRLPKPGDKSQSLELLRGKLFMNISAEEVKKQGNASFRLKTPAALLAVKGTKFFAVSERNVETAGVHEGSVGVLLTRSRQMLDLPAGQAVTASKSGVIQPRLLTEEEKDYRLHYELASSEGRMTNSLEMKFVAVPGTRVMFCIHETRKKDYAAFEAFKYKFPAVQKTTDQTDDHPVTNLTWAEVTEFCEWLSQKESRTYRLPTDLEWSHAVGIGEKEQKIKNATWRDLNSRITKHFPWGGMWPPPRGAGNYCDESYHSSKQNTDTYLKGYDDSFPDSAPVMSFTPNSLGLFDLGGNVWELMAPVMNMNSVPPRPVGLEVVLRGASFNHHEPEQLLSSFRRSINSGNKGVDYGFRLVMALE
jgi:hypothetical protein